MAAPAVEALAAQAAAIQRHCAPHTGPVFTVNELYAQHPAMRDFLVANPPTLQQLSSARVYYLEDVLTAEDIPKLLTDVPQVVTDHVLLQNGEVRAFPSPPDPVRTVPGLLTFEERRRARRKVVASVNRCKFWGGFRSTCTEYAAAFEVVILSMAGPQFNVEALEYQDFMIDDDTGIQALFPSLYPWSCGTKPTMTDTAPGDTVCDEFGTFDAFPACEVRRKGRPCTVKLDQLAYLIAMREDALLVMRAFDDMVERIKDGRRGYLKVSAAGLGVFARIAGTSTSLTSHLAPLLLRAWRYVLQQHQHEFLNIDRVEFVDFENGAFTPDWTINIVAFDVTSSRNRDLLHFTADETENFVCGVICPADCFAMPGNAFLTASVSSMVGNNTDLRLVQSYVHNAHLLDPAHYVPLPNDAADPLDERPAHSPSVDELLCFADDFDFDTKVGDAALPTAPQVDDIGMALMEDLLLPYPYCVGAAAGAPAIAAPAAAVVAQPTPVPDWTTVAPSVIPQGQGLCRVPDCARRPVGGAKRAQRCLCQLHFPTLVTDRGTVAVPGGSVRWCTKGHHVADASEFRNGAKMCTRCEGCSVHVTIREPDWLFVRSPPGNNKVPPNHIRVMMPPRPSASSRLVLTATNAVVEADSFVTPATQGTGRSPEACSFAPSAELLAWLRAVAGIDTPQELRQLQTRVFWSDAVPAPVAHCTFTFLRNLTATQVSNVACVAADDINNQARGGAKRDATGHGPAPSSSRPAGAASGDSHSSIDVSQMARVTLMAFVACKSKKVSMRQVLNGVRSQSGHTLMSIAVLINDAPLVKSLASLGASIRLLTPNGTPLTLARGKPDVLKAMAEGVAVYQAALLKVARDCHAMAAAGVAMYQALLFTVAGCHATAAAAAAAGAAAATGGSVLPSIRSSVASSRLSTEPRSLLPSNRPASITEPAAPSNRVARSRLPSPTSSDLSAAAPQSNLPSSTAANKRLDPSAAEDLPVSPAQRRRFK